MKTLIVIQARTGSVRMPGKVLLPLSGGPLLACMIERVRAARTPAEICVATTDRPEDAPIREIGQRLGVPVLDGHPSDLLDRHFQVGKALNADVVVKIPSDCPLIDPGAIERGAWSVRVYHKPFVTWIWGGCVLMALGGALALSDRRYRLLARREQAAVSAQAPA